jgi:hypothetical protein
VRELFEQIESQEFATRLGLHSGVIQFLRDLARQASVRALTNRMAEDPRCVKATFARLARLADEAIDLRYEHPADTAVAAYLVALRPTSERLYEAARQIVSAMPNTWWARKVVDAGVPVATPSEAVSASPIDDAPERTVTTHVGDESFESLIKTRVGYNERIVHAIDVTARSAANSATSVAGPPSGFNVRFSGDRSDTLAAA